MTIGTLRDQITYPQSIKDNKEDANLLEFLKLVTMPFYCINCLICNNKGAPRRPSRPLLVGQC